MLSCQQFHEQIFAYIDGKLSAEDSARFLEHAGVCSECRAALTEAEAFESGLQSMLKPLEPPFGFSDRVMAALPSAPSNAKIIKFPRRSLFAMIGVAATAAVIALAINFGFDPAANTPIAPPQVAEEPVVTIPVVPTEPDETTPEEQQTVQSAGNDQSTTADTQEPQVPEEQNQDPTTEQQTADIKLPAASYGEDGEGVLSQRLIAALDGVDIYTPSLSSGGKYVTFYTQDENYVYLWRSEVVNPDAPVMIDYWSSNTQIPIKSAAVVDDKTVVLSADHSMLASNTQSGIWFSSLGSTDGMRQLCTEGGGSILVWSPDSSKLVFTDANGALYVGYPVEKQFVQICSQRVNDLCWSSDSSALVFTAEKNGVLALYTITLP